MRYLISYADHNFAKSLERIKKEAEALGIFDRVITYSPADFSDEFKKHPLLKYPKGGGYWVWKAYFVAKTLEQMNNDDILFYVDSGSSLYPSKYWNRYFRILEKKDVLCFMIVRRCGAYTKRIVLEYFNHILGPYWKHYYQIAATTFFIKKSDFTVSLSKEWLTLFTEEMVVDENGPQHRGFIANRHDQSLLCGLLYKYENKVEILNNDFEAKRNGQAIWASRLKDGSTKIVRYKKGWIDFYLKRPLGIFYRKCEQVYWHQMNKLYFSIGK